MPAIDDSGSAAIEYAVLLGLIAVALVSVISGFSEFLLACGTYMVGELERITAMLSR
ncbi:MAG TPA: Flp family type IVb pilin [Hyphomicrobiales bacterium]|nr:Flp family type IVb pilin [Hyphomicrobiales bacterium]